MARSVPFGWALVFGLVSFLVGKAVGHAPVLVQKLVDKSDDGVRRHLEGHDELGLGSREPRRNFENQGAGRTRLAFLDVIVMHAEGRRLVGRLWNLVGKFRQRS